MRRQAGDSEDGGARRPIAWSVKVIAITAVLLWGYFASIWYLLYGVPALCIQKYNAPSWSFHSDTHDCIVTVGDLAEQLVYIGAVVATPLFAALAFVAWVFTRRRRAVATLRMEKVGREALDSSRLERRERPQPFRDEAQIVFWTLTTSVTLPVIAALAGNAIQGFSGFRAEEVVGVTIFYALHLYLAAFIVFSLGVFLVYLRRRLSERKGPSTG